MLSLPPYRYIFDRVPGSTPCYDLGDTSPDIYRVYWDGRWHEGSKFLTREKDRLLLPWVENVDDRSARLDWESVRDLVQPDCQVLFTAFSGPFFSMMSVLDPMWEMLSSNPPDWLLGVEPFPHPHSAPSRSTWDRLLGEDLV